MFPIEKRQKWYSGEKAKHTPDDVARAAKNMGQSIMSGRESTHPDPNRFIYGVGPAIHALSRTINYIAQTEIPILLLGESGTGKPEIALEIHYRSREWKEPFLKFDCRRIPGRLSPAWLSPDSSWKIKGTSKGTIFLDEINQLTPEAQDQLFKILADQDGTHSSPPRAVRVISSSTQSLEDEVRDRRFHEELFYAVSGLCLVIPPIRNRLEDIPALVELLLRNHAAILSRPVPKVRTSTIESLCQYTWPGNVRQLEEIVRKIVELGDDQLAMRFFSNVRVPTSPIVERVTVRHGARPLRQAIQEASKNLERDLIAEALERVQWNRRQAARELQISVRSLRDKMRRHGFNDSDDSQRQTVVV